MFFQVFDGKTDNENMLKNFCGSVADSVLSKSNLVYVRFYAEKSGIESNFIAIFTAMRALEGPMDQCDPDPKVIFNSIFYRIHVFENSIFTKFTFLKLQFSQNSQFWDLNFLKIHIFEISKSRENLDKKWVFAPVCHSNQLF